MTLVPVGRALPFFLPAIAAAVLFRTPTSQAAPPTTQPASFHVGTLEDRRLPELSGLAHSRQHPDLTWAHNDGGSPPELFAITPDGKVVARLPIEGATNVDWEDIAADEKGRLYLADTGNNNRARREITVYRFDEPDPKRGAPIRPTARWTLRYPDAPFDCEAFFVHDSVGYLIPKLRNFQPPVLHRFPLTETDRPVTLEPVAPLPSVRAPVTAATLSPDARHLAVLTVLGPQIFTVDRDPVRATHTPPTGQATFVSPLMESATFLPGGLLGGTEEGNLYLFNWTTLGMSPPAAPSTKPSP
jgi:hypothetical protein